MVLRGQSNYSALTSWVLMTTYFSIRYFLFEIFALESYLLLVVLNGGITFQRIVVEFLVSHSYAFRF